ncbi:endo-1,4-beta-xylanase [Acetivibrio mesophilus]|uniref:Beta-xylanase n=1 Tax=Acetivibrio mesophilus TaxID=2487273 RepID=A0A4Q0I3V6_9FIRM|nr:endo-1,4-beta-xylanase [Acetivibrio mesophilus]ODM26609.1 glycoside hydrolase [Clostridium sp. Bc-iso-3]RXE58960.1 glycoside hydrolase [Acetivibrio mesophilus]HHV28514.1 glycoside hydrolase [Clostridium sp.]
MLKKKLITLLTVFAILAVSVCGSFLTLPKVSAANLIYDDFESGLNGWGPRGPETVELTTEEAYSGKSSLKVSDRTETWNGPMVDISDVLSLGESYKLSVYLKYVGNSYSNEQRFSLQLQYNDGVGDVYQNIKTATVYKGAWTLLEGELAVPPHAQDVKIYVETEYKTSPNPQDLMDFYIDDFKATPVNMPEIEKDIPSLKDVFAGYFKVGGATTVSELAPKPARDLILKHYNSLTFGNELKPDSVLDYDATIAYMEENGGDEVNPQITLRAARPLLEFAKENKIPVRGHTLVWHSQTPDWFFRENYSKNENDPWASKEVMLQRLENYIKNVMEALETEYPTVEFYAWDVVNEAVDPNTSTGMRNPGSNNRTPGNSLWMQTVGRDFIVKSFEYARKYAPSGCKLFYNDYNEYEDRKCDFIIEILTELKEKGLVDGMGMQSHWVMDYPSISMFEKSIKRYAALGLEIQLTELDIKNPDNNPSALERQATRYQQLVTKLIDLKKEGANITALVFWGVTDSTSWLGGYPLLFDGQYKAKPAFYSIVNNVPQLPTPTPVKVKYGDVNEDGVVSSTDFTYLKRYVLKILSDFPTPNGKIAADVNGDGNINSTDVTIMKRYLLKVIDVFPVENK